MLIQSTIKSQKKQCEIILEYSSISTKLVLTTKILSMKHMEFETSN